MHPSSPKISLRSLSDLLSYSRCFFLWSLIYLEKNTFIQVKKKQKITCSQRRNVSWWYPIQPTTTVLIGKTPTCQAAPVLGAFHASGRQPKIPKNSQKWNPGGFTPTVGGKTNGFFVTTWRHDVSNPKHGNWISNNSRSRENRRLRWEFLGGRKTST